MKRQNDILWRLYSFFYDALLVLIPYRMLLKSVADAADLKNTDVVVELGSGTGNVDFISEVPVKDYFGLDFSKAMLGRAQRKNPDSKYLQCDLATQSIPFGDSFADKVISCNYIYCNQRLADLFSEVNRVLKKDGLFVVTSPIKHGFFSIIKDHVIFSSPRDWVLTLLKLQSFVVVFFLNIVIDVLSVGDTHEYRSARQIKTLLEQSGFEVVDTRVCYSGINILFVAREL